MADHAATERFIRATFGSIWSLEMLFVLKQRPDHCWTRDELIRSLRASEQVLARSIADLTAAGLTLVDEDGCARYAPASAALDETVTEVATLYASRPGLVRRLIVGGTDAAASFADAFRFRREKGE